MVSCDVFQASASCELNYPTFTVLSGFPCTAAKFQEKENKNAFRTFYVRHKLAIPEFS